MFSFAELQYSNLCALCEHPEICDYPDENSGYRGALKCLNEAGGDIAWTKTHFVDEYFGVSKPVKNIIWWNGRTSVEPQKSNFFS